MNKKQIDGLLETHVFNVMSCKKVETGDDAVNPRLYLLLQSPPSQPTPKVSINTRNFTDKALSNQNQFLEGASRLFEK